ncbi:MAG TPA: cupredoxin family copper-binding protein [Xanthobacteraceae bacterium]|nr:cupredoxin family copper-binding protein [Xanthobacteraceae bacterium]
MIQPNGLGAAINIARRAFLALAFAAAFAANPAQAEGAAKVTIDNFTFAPAELTVAVGTTVTWENHDDIPHSVVEKNKLFRSRALDTNDAFSFTFTSAGTYDYFCGLHPHMVGKIIVKP